MFSKCIFSSSLYDFFRASLKLLSKEVTAKTRPPLVIIFPSFSEVPAWKMILSVSLSSPEITFPFWYSSG